MRMKATDLKNAVAVLEQHISDLGAMRALSDDGRIFSAARSETLLLIGQLQEKLAGSEDRPPAFRGDPAARLRMRAAQSIGQFEPPAARAAAPIRRNPSPTSGQASRRKS